MNLHVNLKMQNFETYLLSKRAVVEEWDSLESLFMHYEELKDNNKVNTNYKGFIWNFIELRSNIVQQYWNNNFYFSVSLVDDILFQVLKEYQNDLIKNFEKLIKSTKLFSSTGLIIFPLHSLGINNEGIRLFFNPSRTIYYYNKYYKSCFFSQSNSKKQTIRNIKIALSKFQLNTSINEEIFNHKLESRNLNWLTKNPIMILPIDSYSNSYYDTQNFVNNKIFFSTLSVLFYSVIQNKVKKVERKIFSTSNTNNFETLDIKHYMVFQNIINTNSDNIQAIPLHGSQFDIYEEMDLNIELDLLIKTDKKFLKEINEKLVEFEKKYMKYCFYKKGSTVNFRFYTRLYNALKLFKLSFSSKNRNYFSTINLAIAFELLLTDYYAIGVSKRIISRAKNALKYKRNKIQYLEDLENLINNRGDYVHNGRLDVSPMDDLKLIRLRYMFLLIFSKIISKTIVFKKNDNELIGKILD